MQAPRRPSLPPAPNPPPCPPRHPRAASPQAARARPQSALARIWAAAAGPPEAPRARGRRCVAAAAALVTRQTGAEYRPGDVWPTHAPPPARRGAPGQGPEPADPRSPAPAAAPRSPVIAPARRARGARELAPWAHQPAEQPGGWGALLWRRHGRCLRRVGGAQTGGVEARADFAEIGLAPARGSGPRGRRTA